MTPDFSRKTPMKTPLEGARGQGAGQVVLMGGNFVVKAQPYYPPLDAACFHKSPEDFKQENGKQT